jgi:hypothetical protein
MERPEVRRSLQYTQREASRTMRAIMLVLPLCALISLSAAAQVDTSDKVLVAYKLSPGQEAQFTRDGQVSPFWSQWDLRNRGDSVRLDYMELNVMHNAWVTGQGAFSGPQDAELKVRAAYGTAGLYLFFEIRDDNWVLGDYQGTDMLEFFTYRQSSQRIRDCDPYDLQSWCYGYLQCWGTFQPYYVWYRAPLPDSSIPSRVAMSYFDGAAWFTDTVDTTRMRTSYGGIAGDAVGYDECTKLQEWFIPWLWLSNDGDLSSMPPESAMLAFIAGYDDVDSGENTPGSSTRLRWKEKDPVSSCSDMTPPHDYCDSWGDILLGPALGESSAIRPSTRLAGHAANAKRGISSTVWYDLAGRRIQACHVPGIPAHGIGVIVNARGIGTLAVGPGRR